MNWTCSLIRIFLPIVYVQKHFSFLTDVRTKSSRVLDPVKFFKPSLIFAGMPNKLVTFKNTGKFIKLWVQRNWMEQKIKVESFWSSETMTWRKMSKKMIFPKTIHFETLRKFRWQLNLMMICCVVEMLTVCVVVVMLSWWVF